MNRVFLDAVTAKRKLVCWGSPEKSVIKLAFYFLGLSDKVRINLLRTLGVLRVLLLVCP